MFKEYLEKIREKDPQINSFITVVEKPAEQKQGLLAGKTIAVKDNIAVKNIKMTCASKTLENYIAPYDATVIRKIKNAGASIIGKTNMDEFACGSSGETSVYGPTKNPLDTNLVPGGSSSGSAAAVAAGFCDLALGSDTGGSIRCPAAFCGVVGIKPSYGLISRYGLADMAMSLEQIGPLAKNVQDAALLLSIIAGQDEKDCTTTTLGKKDYHEKIEAKIRGKKLGLPKEFVQGTQKQVSEKIEKTLGKLKEEGAEIVELSIPSVKHCVPTYYLTMFSEFSSAMAKYDGLKYGHRAEGDGLVETVSKSREESFGTEIKRRILLGTYTTLKEYQGKWYTKALKTRGLIRKEFNNALSKCDAIVGPTMPVLPWRLGELINDPVKMYLMDILTAAANLTGNPAGVVPVGKKSFPTGFQIMTGYGEEQKLLNIMKAVEEVEK